MGEKVEAGSFDLADRHAFRRKLQQCQRALERMLDEKRFDRPKNLLGLEIELNLAGSDGLPRMMNQQVLERIASRDFQTELGMFNLEVNIAPHRLGDRVLDRLAEELRIGLGYADRKAGELDAGIVMIGILPTLTRDDLVSANLTDVDRYRLLNDEIVAARGEEFPLDIEGVERLRYTASSIAPEAACTSVQLHLQVTPDRFADVWNAAQAVAAVQIAIGANSPFLFGKELWRESRAPLFLQSIDTRPVELQVQGVRPRTWFGERWISSARELFAENLRYFPGLLPICSEEDPEDVLAAGRAPSLAELVLHNGTVYRWNRPVYGVADGVPHLRVENRVLPAGPTVVDVVANAAFYYGLVRSLAESRTPVWTKLPSRRPRPTSTPPAGTGSTPGSPGPGAASTRGPPRPTRPPSFWRSCSRSPPPGWTPGASTRPTGTATSASSRPAAAGGPTAPPGRRPRTTGRGRAGWSGARRSPPWCAATAT